MSGQIEMLASPFNARRTVIKLFYSPNGRQVARGIRYRELGRRRVDMRPPDKGF